ncbi:MAG TPA: hypothetical protein VFH56_11050 [Acidimicrobiales bacterium]|nr:hypothetical protein [Acidimicrobiales bacterium]
MSDEQDKVCRDCAYVGYHCGRCLCCRPAGNLGWWTISGEALMDALRRAHDGEDPDLIYTEQYANSDVRHFEEGR